MHFALQINSRHTNYVRTFGIKNQTKERKIPNPQHPQKMEWWHELAKKILKLALLSVIWKDITIQSNIYQIKKVSGEVRLNLLILNVIYLPFLLWNGSTSLKLKCLKQSEIYFHSFILFFLPFSISFFILFHCLIFFLPILFSFPFPFVFSMLAKII